MLAEADDVARTPGCPGPPNSHLWPEWSSSSRANSAWLSRLSSTEYPPGTLPIAPQFFPKVLSSLLHQHPGHLPTPVPALPHLLPWLVPLPVPMSQGPVQVPPSLWKVRAFVV